MKDSEETLKKQRQKLQDSLENGLVASGPLTVASLADLASGTAKSGLKLETSEVSTVTPFPKKK